MYKITVRFALDPDTSEPSAALICTEKDDGHNARLFSGESASDCMVLTRVTWDLLREAVKKEMANAKEVIEYRRKVGAVPESYTVEV